jgi:hypothetical protein
VLELRCAINSLEQTQSILVLIAEKKRLDALERGADRASAYSKI